MDKTDVPMTERELQDTVLEVLEWQGWKVFHDEDSRRNRAGFPDCCAVKGSRLMFIEFKSAKGKLRTQQRQWLDELAQATYEVYLVRPKDLDEIVAIISGVYQPTITCHWNSVKAVDDE